MAGPLEGVKVLDVTQVVLGPWATQILGDMGADVIKLEPLAGDITRRIGPARNPGMAALFLAVNRNKRSLAVDLKQPDGRALLSQLLQGVDVVIQAMRPGAAARLGLDYESVAAANPAAIYVACQGFRSDSPEADRPAYDDVVQSRCGLVDLQRRAGGTPRYVPSILCDKTMSLQVVANIAMALVHRLRTGQGQRIETSMFENMAAFTLLEHQQGAIFDPPVGALGYGRLLAETRRPYLTGDDRAVSLLPYHQAHWERFTRLAAFRHLADDVRFVSVERRHENAAALYAEIAAAVRQCPAEALIRSLSEADIPVAEVSSLDDLLEDPHLEALGLWQRHEHPSEGPLRLFGIPSTFSRTPGAIRRLPPRLGEHTGEVLREFGIAATRVAELTAQGVIAEAEEPVPAQAAGLA